ncbi:MAG: hypothetical protein J3K34DRAFT_413211 [Monoraphidium minutum]|nr:MAG: hypothetical protein J3K34DRAFT_413211 [Monoraphidium minutum]
MAWASPHRSCSTADSSAASAVTAAAARRSQKLASALPNSSHTSTQGQPLLAAVNQPASTGSAAGQVQREGVVGVQRPQGQRLAVPQHLQVAAGVGQRRPPVAAPRAKERERDALQRPGRLGHHDHGLERVGAVLQALQQVVDAAGELLLAV